MEDHRREHMTSNEELGEVNWPEGMSEDDRQELRGLLAAYDGALIEFYNDRKVIFPSDAERKRLIYGFFKRWQGVVEARPLHA